MGLDKTFEQVILPKNVHTGKKKKTQLFKTSLHSESNSYYNVENNIVFYSISNTPVIFEIRKNH